MDSSYIEFMNVSDIEKFINNAEDLSKLNVHIEKSTDELYYKSSEIKQLLSDKDWRILTSTFVTTSAPQSEFTS